MAEQFKNNAQSTLASSCVIGDTAVIVANAASFPTMGEFRLLIDNELMLVTTLAGTIFNVTRGIEGTTEAAHALGAACILPLTAGSLATIGGGGGGPTGPAGGVLAGTYPNPDIDASIAGSGLAEAANVLSVNVDASSIEINADTLRVKALGITNAMLAGSIADSKLSSTFLKASGATALTGDLDANGHKIINLADPAALQDAATLAALNANASGLMATSVVVATVAPLPSCTYANGSSGVGATLTATANGSLTVDGVTIGVRDRVLVMNQVSTLQNGIYRCSQAGDLTHPFILVRSQDMQFDNEFSHRVVFILLGSAQAGRSVWCTTDTPVIGTDPVSFSFFALTDGGSKSVTLSVANANETSNGHTAALSLSFGTVVV